MLLPDVEDDLDIACLVNTKVGSIDCLFLIRYTSPPEVLVFNAGFPLAVFSLRGDFTLLVLLPPEFYTNALFDSYRGQLQLAMCGLWNRC